MADLKQITVFLPPAEVETLETEAQQEGQSGVSARIRWILEQRRRERTT